MTTEPQTRTKLKGITTGQRIEADLRRRVIEGQWTSNAPLPSRRDLARQYGVDLRTVQKAISGLLTDNTLRSDGPRGTFIGPKALGSNNGVKHAPAANRITSVGILLESALEANSVRFPAALASVESAISSHGAMCLTLDLRHPQYSGLSIKEGIAYLENIGVDGIVSLLDTSPQTIEPLLNSTAAHQAPIVHAGGALSHSYRLSVNYSSTDASFRAAGHLIQRGCSRILVFSAFNAEWVRQRIQGACEAASAHDLPGDAIQTSIGDLEIFSIHQRPNVQQIQVDGAYEAALEVLSAGLPADGIIAVNDHNAYGFIKAASELRLKTGTDYAIVGFDDFRDSAVLGLSSIRPPHLDIGREAVEMLVNEIASPGASEIKCLPSELITRMSTMSYKSR